MLRVVMVRMTSMRGLYDVTEAYADPDLYPGKLGVENGL